VDCRAEQEAAARQKGRWYACGLGAMWRKRSKVPSVALTAARQAHAAAETVRTPFTIPHPLPLTHLHQAGVSIPLPPGVFSVCLPSGWSGGATVSETKELTKRA
jgi:hypothetical protein